MSADIHHVMLDVDGVINALGMEQKAPEWGWGQVYDREMINGWWITHSPSLVDWLNAMAAHPQIQFHWLTTWLHDAPTILAPAIGLNGEHWPVVGKEHYDRHHKIPFSGSATTETWWKYDAMVNHVVAHPDVTSFVWIDDHLAIHKPLTEGLLQEANRIEATSPNPRTGLTRDDAIFIEQDLAFRYRFEAPGGGLS